MKDVLKWVVYGGLFIIPFLPMYVANGMFFPFITGKNFAFRIIVEIVFAAWILLAFYEPKFRPKFSYILVAFGTLLAVMCVADAFGQDPFKSFWSNFERMDGYITLVHVFLYTFVLASVATTERFWKYFLNTALAVALFVAISGLLQYFNGVTGRIDAQLGNAAYMAIYMLFSMFFSLYLALKADNRALRAVYIVGAILFAYAVILTGTRGTFLGMIGGAVVTIGYIALFGRTHPRLRRLAVYATIGFVILASLFWAFRDSAPVQHVPTFKRIANINFTSDLKVRETIWHMAWEGVQERPVLGWGQGNFNYVFNKFYEPSLYGQEQWFDRAHDIFFDWLTTGGVLGLLAYFSIMAAMLWYLVIEPGFLKRESTFTVLERAVLFGILSGYLIHNVVVFDNIISYIFYGTLLALVHSKVGKPWAKVQAFKADQALLTQFALPIVLVVTAFVVYLVNVPGIMAANDLIGALTSNTAAGRLQYFNDAFNEHSFATQEIVEQMSQQAINIVQDQNVSTKDKQAFVTETAAQLQHLNAVKPHDARVESFMGSFYRAIGDLANARKYMADAVADSPNKPSLIVNQGVVELQAGNMQAALAFLKKAYELDTSNQQARIIYAAALMQDKQTAAAEALLTAPADQAAFAANAYAISVTQGAGDYPFLAKLLKARIAADPTNLQDRASLAFVYYQMHEATTAVATLRQAAKDIPAQATLANCYADNIAAGKTPSAGCQ